MKLLIDVVFKGVLWNHERAVIQFKLNFDLWNPGTNRPSDYLIWTSVGSSCMHARPPARASHPPRSSAFDTLPAWKTNALVSRSPAKNAWQSCRRSREVPGASFRHCNWLSPFIHFHSKWFLKVNASPLSKKLVQSLLKWRLSNLNRGFKNAKRFLLTNGARK